MNFIMKRLYILFFAIAFIVLIYFSLYLLGVLYPDNEMFIYPYSASIWGNVADWIMIIVTSVTAFFLYLSLLSQREVQKMQQSLSIIEQSAYLDKIKPDFICKIKWDERSGEYYRATLSLELIKNLPYNLKYHFAQISDDFADVSGHENGIDTMSNQIGSIILFHIKFKTPSKKGIFGSLELTFEDTIGTQYLAKFLVAPLESETCKKAGPMVAAFPSFLHSNELKNLTRRE